MTCIKTINVMPHGTSPARRGPTNAHRRRRRRTPGRCSRGKNGAIRFHAGGSFRNRVTDTAKRASSRSEAAASSSSTSHPRNRPRVQALRGESQDPSPSSRATPCTISLNCSQFIARPSRLVLMVPLAGPDSGGPMSRNFSVKRVARPDAAANEQCRLRMPKEFSPPLRGSLLGRSQKHHDFAVVGGQTQNRLTNPIDQFRPRQINWMNQRAADDRSSEGHLHSGGSSSAREQTASSRSTRRKTKFRPIPNK